MMQFATSAGKTPETCATFYVGLREGLTLTALFENGSGTLSMTVRLLITLGEGHGGGAGRSSHGRTWRA
jgi:hypothetical protein